MSVDRSPGDSTSSGKAGRIRALAFAGGAFDTIMQMGVVHALLVSRSKAPHHVVGISAGAVNGVALAEVMQAGKGLRGRERLLERVRKLRQILDKYLELPQTFVSSALPDAFEVNAKRPLKPIELPVHVGEERNSRADASRSKAGLVRLLNDLFSINLHVGAATRIIRRVLALRQAEELPRPVPAGETMVLNAVFLWCYVGMNFLPLSGLASRLANAALTGRHGGVLRWLESSLPAAMKRVRFTELAEWLEKRLRTDAATAGKAIQLPVTHYVVLAVRTGFTGIALLLLWLAPLYLMTPPEDLARHVPRVMHGPLSSEGAIGSVREAAAGVASALLNLTEETPFEFFANIGASLAPPIAGIASWIWGVVGYNWLKIAGVLVVIALAIGIESLSSARYAAWFVGVWVCGLAFAYPQPRLVVIVLLVVTFLVLRSRQGRLRRRILEHYEICDALFSADILKHAFVQCFDPDYFGRAQTAAIIDAALAKAKEAGGPQAVEKMRLGDYADPSRREPAIHVAPVAANINGGDLEILRPEVPVVEALIASTAVVPFFPAQPIENTRASATNPTTEWFIDGLNVSNEPIQPLFRYLRADHDRDPAKYAGVETVDIYPVSDVPVDEVVRQEGEYSTLVDVGLRALELKQFRDASVERRLTRLYTRTLPRGRAFNPVPLTDPAEKTPRRTFIHADLFPIELEKPARVNRRLFRGAGTDDFKRILRETVADGCRATLEAMLPASLYNTERADELIDWTQRLVEFETASSQTELLELVTRILTAPDFPQNVVFAASHAVNVEDGVTLKFDFRNVSADLLVTREQFDDLRRIIYPRCHDVIRSRLADSDPTLPGSDGVSGPGLSEICRHCRLSRPDEASRKKRRVDDARDALEQQRLRVIPARSDWPQWPLEHESDGNAAQRPPVCAATPEPDLDPEPYRQWLGNRQDRPIVSFLFGGGVFRGVFHMGVMTALNEAGLEPDLVAGSSVGSIVASMIASAFKAEAGERHRRITSLAATFLAIDRLVLTDRLADFVRRFTLRAAEAEFSPRDIDRALRHFDRDDPKRFGRRLRKVAAGLERLFYFSPFELLEVLRDVRRRDGAAVFQALIQDVQELFDRGGLAEEFLGSESLALLIDRHVVRGHEMKHFESFRRDPNRIFFLATAVNLVNGLEILGAPWNGSHTDVLTEFGLLASSAFPAVFRPRQAWEIFGDTERGDQKYIDGGTIDNLPLDAVARFLSNASHAGVVNKRSVKGDIPHLLFTASLEVSEAVHRVPPDQLREEATEWLALMRRAGRFKYNRKIDAYASVQRRLRQIHAHFRGQSAWTPLNMHVLAVKPNWLCGTFGFHPMLGFKRRKQAQSIAHGCASTLGALAGAQNDHPEWFNEWTTTPGVTKKQLDIDAKAVGNRRNQLDPQPRDPARGLCWFRVNRTCPFSTAATDAANTEALSNGKEASVTPAQRKELHEIYVECGRRDTHQPER